MTPDRASASRLDELDDLIGEHADFRSDHRYVELRDSDSAVNYTTGSRAEFAGSRVDVSTSPEAVADLILSGLPRLLAAGVDPRYAEWYASLMRLVEEHDSLPIAYADYFDEKPGWEIGWGSGIRYPHPPPPPTA